MASGDTSVPKTQPDVETGTTYQPSTLQILMDDGRIPEAILKRAKGKEIPTQETVDVKVSLMANGIRNETGHEWSEVESDASTSDNEPMGFVEILATVGAFFFMIITFPVSIFMVFKVVQEYERAVIFRLGRLRTGGARGPGIFFVLPCIDVYAKVDLRTVSFDVPPQEILSRDSVTVHVDAVVFYRVNSPTMATNNVENYSHSTRLLAATTLRNVLGTRNLAEILAERETISHTMQSALDIATEPWGVKVERVEIKDVRLPVQMQRAMAAEAEATREARAKVIAAEGEMRAARSLKEASDVIAESPAALQLRYLQTLNTISAEKNSTIVFPLPMDIITPFLSKSK